MHGLQWSSRIFFWNQFNFVHATLLFPQWHSPVRRSTKGTNWEFWFGKQYGQHVTLLSDAQRRNSHRFVYVQSVCVHFNSCACWYTRVQWRTQLRPYNRATSNRDLGLNFHAIKFSKIYHLITRKGEKLKKK